MAAAAESRLIWFCADLLSPRQREQLREENTNPFAAPDKGRLDAMGKQQGVYYLSLLNIDSRHDKSECAGRERERLLAALFALLSSPTTADNPKINAVRCDLHGFQTLHVSAETRESTSVRFKTHNTIYRWLPFAVKEASRVSLFQMMCVANVICKLTFA